MSADKGLNADKKQTKRSHKPLVSRFVALTLFLRQKNIAELLHTIKDSEPYKISYFLISYN